jgi:hypothetical protein
MQNAEWTGRAGADHWDVGVAHCDISLCLDFDFDRREIHAAFAKG